MFEDDVHFQTQLLEQMSDAVFLISENNGLILFANLAAENMFGYERGEMYEMSVSKLNDPYPQVSEKIIIDALHKENKWQGEIHNIKKNGSPIICYARVTTFIHPKYGDVWLSVYCDITKRKNAEDELLASEKRFRHINSHIPGVLYQFKIDTKGNRSLPYASPTTQSILGLSPDELINDVEKWFSLVHPEDLTSLESSIDASMKDMSAWYWEGRFIKNNTETVWLRGSSTPVKQEDDSIVWDGMLVDVTKNKQSDQELNKFKSILDQTHDCVFMFDAVSLEFFYVNEGALQQTGYSRNELLGMHPYDIKPDHTERSFRNFIAPLLSGDEEVLNFETIHQAKDGSKITVEISLKYVSANINGESFVAIVRDITERTLTEMELDNYRGVLETLVDERTADLSAARDEAEKANVYKSEFLSRMSHELRTPLNAILGFSQLLELDSETFNENQQENIQEIIDAGNHLLNLVNDVLDLSKIEAGMTEISMVNVSLDDLIKQCLTLIRPLADTRNITILDNISGSDYVVTADFIRFKQVIINLLSNAVKYNCESGQITLTCEVIREHYIRINITDTGDGLTHSEIAKLFSPFERLNNNSNVEGAGIGLVITRQLTELMGGCMGVQSIPGAGSTFWVEFSLSNDERD